MGGSARSYEAGTAVGRYVLYRKAGLGGTVVSKRRRGISQLVLWVLSAIMVLSMILGLVFTVIPRPPQPTPPPPSPSPTPTVTPVITLAPPSP